MAVKASRLFVFSKRLVFVRVARRAGDRHSLALCRLQMMVYWFGGALFGASGFP